MNFSHLLPPSYENEVCGWLKDDIPSFDIGGFVVGDKQEVAHLLCKTSSVLAGIPFAQAIFNYVDCNVEWLFEEGHYIELSGSPVVVAIVRGSCRNILIAERTILNIISRAAGVATQAKRGVEIARSHNWQGFVAGTRKTTPGFRLVEKYALIVGGAATHRLDLSQMVMLKDNHIWSTGSITAAVKKSIQAAGFSMKIEVECQSVEDAMEAASAGANIVMLDNFSPSQLHAAASTIKESYPSLLIEASGGITEENMHLYMGPHIDILSRGSFTQGYPCCDYSLKIQKNK